MRYYRVSVQYAQQLLGQCTMSSSYYPIDHIEFDDLTEQRLFKNGIEVNDHSSTSKRLRADGNTLWVYKSVDGGVCLVRYAGNWANLILRELETEFATRIGNSADHNFWRFVEVRHLKGSSSSLI